MAQVTVKKKNKVLNIEDTRLESYLMQGYDQVDKDGNVVEKATGGKTVSLSEYNKVVEELEAAKAKVDELSSADLEVELAEAKKEIKNLKTENTKLKKEADKTAGGE